MTLLFTGLGAAVGGLFTAVVLCGLLAGLIAYGMMDRWWRAQLQRHVTVGLIERPVKRALEDPERRHLMIQLLEQRYRDAVLPKTIGLPVDSYIKYIWCLCGSGSLVPSLLRLPEQSAYALHYRQLCGQMAATIQGEALRETKEINSPAPLTDILAFASMLRQTVDCDPRAEAERDGKASYTAMLDNRSAAERAMAEVDLLQIRISETLASRASSLSLVLVLLVFGTLLVSTASYLNMAGEGARLWGRLAGGLGAVAIAFVLAVLLTLSAGVISALTFRLIDRVASPR